MANGERFISDVLRIMRLALAKRNVNDPDSSDDTFMTYINDFVSLSMSNDARFFELFGTLSFTIDETNTTGVYTFNDVGADSDFVTISGQAFISLLDPSNNSVSWNQLEIYQDPAEFFSIWGINNDEILISGYPTAMLFYGNEFTFRTIPNVAYVVKIFGYKKNVDYSSQSDEIQFDYWLRYIAYGAALDYARDYNLDMEKQASIKQSFSHERKLMLTRTHNQQKTQRCLPRF